MWSIFSLWLNEGFASYVETIGAAQVEPDASIMERFCIDNTYDTMEIDALQTSHPISVKVKHPNEINEIFDRISYGKGKKSFLELFPDQLQRIDTYSKEF